VIAEVKLIVSPVIVTSHDAINSSGNVTLDFIIIITSRGTAEAAPNTVAEHQ
jgi:hypothetical protein